MIDTLVQFLQSAHGKTIMVAVGVLVIWVLAKALRWILNIFLFIALIFIVIWKIPSVHAVFASLIK